MGTRSPPSRPGWAHLPTSGTVAASFTGSGSDDGELGRRVGPVLRSLAFGTAPPACTGQVPAPAGTGQVPAPPPRRHRPGPRPPHLGCGGACAHRSGVRVPRRAHPPAARAPREADRAVRLPFPSPTLPYPSRAEVLLGYLAYFRSVLVAKLD